MSEAKKLDSRHPSPPMPRLLDDLPPISVQGPGVSPYEHANLGFSSPDQIPPIPSLRSAPKSGSWLTRILLIMGCVFVCFGIGVGVASMILSGSLDLKGLAWIKEILHHIQGK